MELVYIWVEKYKNIVLKGFNLSPKFDCQYEPNKLTIKRKKYLKIFSKNIDITAFIGTNGSGKTSLLEIIQLLCLESANKTQNNEHIWGIFYNEESEKFYCDSLISENIGFNSIVVKDIDKNDITKDYKENRNIESNNNKYYFDNVPRNTFYNIWYNPSIELVSSKFLNYIHDSSKEFYGHIFDLDFKPSEINTFAFPSKKNGMVNIKKNENTIILNMFKTIALVKEFDFKNLFNSDKISFTPKRVSFGINFEDLEYHIQQQYIRDIVLQNQLTLNIKDLHRYFLALILSSVIIDYEDNSFKEYFFKDKSVIKNYLVTKYNETDASVSDYDYRLKQMYNNLYDNIDEFIELTKDIELFDSLIDNSKLNFNVNEISKLIDTMKKHNINTFPNSTSNENEILILLKNLPSFINVEAIDKKHAIFSDFSYGEKNIIQLIYSLLYHITLLGKDKILNILLDEIELGLNPRWQKELINTLQKLLENDLFIDTKFNIFLSSHSPFVLSDLPKENVVFLESGAQSYPDIQTFGANIHTLLSHGFFMKNGLIGEYAKAKINELIEYLNGSTQTTISDNKNAQYFINMVGEPVLRLQLQKMLDSKRIEKVDKIDLIEQQIQELSKELEKLKNG